MKIKHMESNVYQAQQTTIVQRNQEKNTLFKKRYLSCSRHNSVCYKI